MASHSTRGFLAGFVMGAALGAIASLLFAPGPGSELRRSIAETSGELKHRAANAGRRLGREAAPSGTGGRGPKGARTRTSGSDGR
jgi:gas vesicle protein